MSDKKDLLTPSAHLGYLFNELPLPERFPAARAAGFRNVELPCPYSLGISEFRSLCTSNDLRVAQIALPNIGGTEKGLAALPGREADFTAALEQAIEYALAVQCPLIHPMAGTLEPDQTREVWPLYIRNLKQACAAAAAVGLKVIIEPIGHRSVPNYFMHDARIALSAIHEIRASNVLLLFDTYHAAGSGIDPAGFVQTFSHFIGHIQIADDPGRNEPGTGDTNFDIFFRTLLKLGYRGSIGLEYHPSSGTLESLTWLRRYEGTIEQLCT